LNGDPTQMARTVEDKDMRDTVSREERIFAFYSPKRYCSGKLILSRSVRTILKIVETSWLGLSVYLVADIMYRFHAAAKIKTGETQMKRVFAVMIIAICAVASAQAQTLTSADRDSAMKYLQSTKQGVLDATQGLTAAQWNFKPAPDRWSAAEVVEHLAAAEDMFYGMITTQVLKAPPHPAGDDVKAIDQMILVGVPDRSHKAQAPEPLKPTNRYGSPDAALKHFVESRDRTEDLLTKNDELRAHAADSPMGKKLDGYEWILFAAAHSERHTKQINEVKADPNFPK
jgi:hypothetical protein